MGRALLLLLLLCAISIHCILAAGPVVTSATYKTKSGQTNQAEVTLLEYQMDFDQDLHYLEAIECGSAATCRPVNPNGCGPCDYSDYFASTCGTAPRSPPGVNCPCPLKATLCNPSSPAPDAVVGPPLHLVVDGPALNGSGDFPVAFQSFRFFISDTLCKAVRINIVVEEGQWETAISPTSNVLDRTNASYRWYSYRSSVNNLLVCPNDPLSSGTFYMKIVGYGKWILNAVSIPLATTGVLPPPPVIPTIRAPYQLIYSDAPVTKNLSAVRSSYAHTYFAIVTYGPCPRLWSISAYMEDYRGSDLRGTVITIGSDPDDILKRDLFPNNITENVLWDQSFPARLAASYCPADPTKPDVLYFSVETDGDPGLLTIYYTSNKAKFLAMPIPPVMFPAAPYAMANLLQTALVMQCDTYFVLPCADNKARGVGCEKNWYSALAPLVEPSPLWPPIGFFFDDADTQLDAPGFLTNQYLSNRLSWMYVTNFRLETPDVTLVNSSLPPAAIPLCQARVRPHIVNAQFEAASDALVSLKSVPMVCTQEAFVEAIGVIGNLTNQISPANSAAANRNISHQLDYWNFRDAWQSCLELANALFNTDRQTAVVDSTYCTDSTDRADPCCSSDGWWVFGCCEPRPVALPLVARQLNPTVIDAICSAPPCISTYLTDFSAVANVSCADALVTQKRVENLADMPVADCQDAVYGTNLDGRPCSSDDDCWGYRCDRRRGACIMSMAAKHRKFIECIVEHSDVQVMRILYEKTGVDPSLTGSALVEALFNAPRFADGDCVGETEFWPGVQQHMEISWSDTCIALCASELYGWDAFASNWPPCGNSVQYNAVPGCGDARQTTFASNKLKCDTAPSVCNQNPFLGPTVNNVTCAARPPACVLCWNETYCVPAPAGFATDQASCSMTYACELVNGSLYWLQGPNVTQLRQACEAIGDCSGPCLDQFGIPRTCPNRTACETRGGYCTDVFLFFHDPGTGGSLVPGACILPRRGVDPCSQTYLGAPWDAVVTQDYGCVFRAYSPRLSSPPLCENAQYTGGYSFPVVFNGTWRMPATNEAECRAHGCGCLRPQFFNMETTQSVPISAPRLYGPRSTPEECAACGGYECVDYYQWIASEWQGGILRPTTWQQARWLPVVNWEHTFKATLFVQGVRDAAASSWQRQFLSETQCRFNRVSAALHAAACLCSGNADGACLDSINEDAPIASGYICGGLTQTVQAVPHQFKFSPSSVTPTGSCVSLTFYSVSRLRFANIAPSQSLSTYFTSVKKGVKDGSFAFLNAKGAAVGEVAGEGLRVVTPPNVSNVTVCFAAAFIAAKAPLDSDHAVADIAFTADDLTRLTPMELTVSRDDEYWCASVAALSNGSYIPVWRVAKWASAKAPGLRPGQVIVLALCSVLYFFVMIAAAFVAFLVATNAANKVPCVRLPRFWLCVLLCCACFIRGLYFALLGSQVVKDSTVADVILVELPTFIWFTATTLLCLFWFAAVFQKQASRVERLFWRLFFIVNAAMYIVFIVFVVVFSQIKDTTTSSCNGRLPISVDRSKRRGAFVAYQIFLFVMAFILSLLFAGGGILLVCFLRGLNKDVQSNGNEESLSIQRSVSITAGVCAIGFLLHAIFLLALALASPGLPSLAIVLVLVELIPSFFVLYSAVPNETKKQMTETLSRSNSTRSRESGDSGISVSERSASSDGYVLHSDSK